jgi:uncharacterized protein (DUF433 family)
MHGTITDLDNERAASVTPVEAAWLTELSPKAINATIDRGELKIVKKKGATKKRGRNLGPADVLYLMLRKDLAAALSAAAKRELYQRLTEARLEVLSDWNSPIAKQCDAEIKLAGGVIRIEMKSTCSRLASRWRALRNATQLVVSDPNIRGGEPVIRNTRVPVYMIADLVKQGADPREILEDYPSIDAPMVEGALAYAQTHPKRGRPSKAPWTNLKRAS